MLDGVMTALVKASAVTSTPGRCIGFGAKGGKVVGQSLICSDRYVSAGPSG